MVGSKVGKRIQARLYHLKIFGFFSINNAKLLKFLIMKMIYLIKNLPGSLAYEEKN